MSGGSFDYVQYQMQEAADKLKQLLKGDPIYDDYRYSEETLNEFKKGLWFLELAELYLNRIDWLVSGDDGEDTFHERLEKEINKLWEKWNDK